MGGAGGRKRGTMSSRSPSMMGPTRLSALTVQSPTARSPVHASKESSFSDALNSKGEDSVRDDGTVSVGFGFNNIQQLPEEREDAGNDHEAFEDWMVTSESNLDVIYLWFL